MLDLCVQWRADTCREVLEGAVELDYKGVAFTTVVEEVSPTVFRNWKDGQYRLEVPPELRRGLRSRDDLRNLRLVFGGGPFLQVRRLHVVLKNAGAITPFQAYLKQHAAEHDLVSATVGDEAVWVNLVNQPSSMVDIVRLDLYAPLGGFRIRRALLGLAVAKGIFFEICLDKALMSTAMAAVLLRNLLPLLRHMPVSALLITSGAQHPLGQRAPQDLEAFAATLLGPAAARTIVRDNPAACLQRAAARRTAPAPGFFQP